MLVCNFYIMDIAGGKWIRKTLQKIVMIDNILIDRIFDQECRNIHVETEVEDLEYFSQICSQEFVYSLRNSAKTTKSTVAV